MLKMIYQIKQDCRIANIDYKKGDLVTVEEVGQYYPTIMQPVEVVNKKSTEKVENKGEKKADVEETKEEATEETKEPKEVSKPKAKKPFKKK